MPPIKAAMVYASFSIGWAADLLLRKPNRHLPEPTRVGAKQNFANIHEKELPSKCAGFSVSKSEIQLGLAIIERLGPVVE
jgi:hypothetical protein